MTYPIERFLGRRLSRRGLLRGAAGLAAAAWTACGPKGPERISQLPEPATPAATTAPTAVAKVVETTPTIETRNTERAIINLGNWELAVVGWDEPDLKPDPQEYADLQSAEKYKSVTVQLVARNISNEYLDSETISENSAYFDFRLFNPKSNGVFHGRVVQYLKYGGGILKNPYITNSDGTLVHLDKNKRLKSIRIPPGFGLPMGVLFEVAKERSDYGFAVVPLQGGLPNPHRVYQEGQYLKADPALVIQRGEIAQDYGLIAPNIELKSPSEPFIYNFVSSLKAGQSMQFRLLGKFEGQSPTDNRVAQGLVFELANNTSNPIEMTTDNFGLVVYLKDGRLIPLQDVLMDAWVNPGQSGRFTAIMAVSESDPQAIGVPEDKRLYGLVDLDESVVVFSFAERFIAWKI